MKINKKWLNGLIVLVGVVAVIFLVVGLKQFEGRVQVDNSKIGWISDIHADRFKRRSVDSGTLYPRQYKEYLPKVFDAMRGQGVSTVIATGDNVNSGDNNYAKDVLRIAQEKNMRVIWVAGNHDNDQTMKTLGIDGNKYYFIDYGETRIIVLDDAKITRETGDYLGGVDDQQLDWLQGALKTEKQVIVAMHIPIFPISLENTVQDRYLKLEKLFQDSGNVKMVLSGHLHVPWHLEHSGINYYGEGALTYENAEGSYVIINLEDNSANYLFAK